MTFPHKILQLIAEETKYEHLVRILMAFIATVIIVSMIALKDSSFIATETVFTLLFALVVVFVFGGMLFNVLAYRATSGLVMLIKLFTGIQIPQELTYRSIVIGHLPMLFSILTLLLPNESISPALYLKGLWSTCILLSILLLFYSFRYLKSMQD